MLDSALDEIARAADTPAPVGASVLCAYPARDGSLRFLDHPDFEPALALAEQLRLPLFVHASARYPLGTQDLPGLAGAFVTGGMAMLVESTLCLLRLIASGHARAPSGPAPGLRAARGRVPVPARAPRVHRPAARRRRARHPRDHVDHLYVDTHSMDAPAIACATDVLGEERILFGSDFPVTPPALGRA